MMSALIPAALTNVSNFLCQVFQRVALHEPSISMMNGPGAVSCAVEIKLFIEIKQRLVSLPIKDDKLRFEF